ncbi:hypothetical protein IQ07DRAFT_681852 [Pyrenochaeta sp. DS3sAY3a]|nr:hypothetical protein IQ07DRAFT_681852 [Pyrenochaeta sp. DS3sAY3a]
MRPHFACYLSATLPDNPQNHKLEWDLYTSFQWEKRIPFHTYVQSTVTAKSLLEEVRSSSQLVPLPLEIQLHVLDFCSASTLFQVMHTSHKLRVEAAKLFWSQKNAYYYVEAYWLLEGAYAGSTNWNLDFLASVQNIEIDCDSASLDKILSSHDDKVNIQQDRITTFWKSITSWFPDVKQVLLSYPYERWENLEPALLPLHALVQACPLSIEIYTLVREKKTCPIQTGCASPYAKKIWRSVAYRLGSGGFWIQAAGKEQHETILMPPKKFSGPVGEFSQLWYQSSIQQLRKWAFWPLVIRAIAHYYLEATPGYCLACPVQTCGDNSHDREEWVAHLVELHLPDWKKLDIAELDLLPGKTRKLLEEHSQGVEGRIEAIRQEFQKRRDEWDQAGATKQKLIERSWLEQLAHDRTWDTGEHPEKSRLWTRYLQSMGAVPICY